MHLPQETLLSHAKKHHGHRRRQKISRGEQRKSAFYFLTQGYVKIKIVKLFLDFSVFFCQNNFILLNSKKREISFCFATTLASWDVNQRDDFTALL